MKVHKLIFDWTLISFVKVLAKNIYLFLSTQDYQLRKIHITPRKRHLFNSYRIIKGGIALIWNIRFVMPLSVVHEVQLRWSVCLLSIM